MLFGEWNSWKEGCIRIQDGELIPGTPQPFLLEGMIQRETQQWGMMKTHLPMGWLDGFLKFVKLHGEAEGGRLLGLGLEGPGTNSFVYGLDSLPFMLDPHLLSEGRDGWVYYIFLC